jgi:hypothetical protein
MSTDVEVIHGDCLEVMRRMADASVDAVVTDPPAGIKFMGKEWDTPGAFVERKPDRSVKWDKVGGNHNPVDSHDRQRTNRVERGRFVDRMVPIFAEALRLAKPGAHALVWALPRTSHWTALALEDAGWQIDDRLAHCFGQGFPKHKSKLKPAVEDWWLCTKPGGAKWLNVDGCRVANPTGESAGGGWGWDQHGREPGSGKTMNEGWNGQPSSQHPAGRWPPHWVLTHHHDCRPCGTKRVKASNQPGRSNGTIESGIGFGPDGSGKPRQAVYHTDPTDYGMETVEAWDCVEGLCPVAEMDRQSGERKAGARPSNRGAGTKGYHGWPNGTDDGVRIEFDSGGASRFFPRFAWETDDFPFRYCGKASREERNVGLDGMPERRTRQVRLRDDLTDEELAYVMRELKSAGVSV